MHLNAVPATRCSWFAAGEWLAIPALGEQMSMVTEPPPHRARSAGPRAWTGALEIRVAGRQIRWRV